MHSSPQTCWPRGCVSKRRAYCLNDTSLVSNRVGSGSSRTGSHWLRVPRISCRPPSPRRSRQHRVRMHHRLGDADSGPRSQAISHDLSVTHNRIQVLSKFFRSLCRPPVGVITEFLCSYPHSSLGKSQAEDLTFVCFRDSGLAPAYSQNVFQEMTASPTYLFR